MKNRDLRNFEGWTKKIERKGGNNNNNSNKNVIKTANVPSFSYTFMMCICENAKRRHM